MLKIADYYPNTNIPFPLEELEKFNKYDFIKQSDCYLGLYYNDDNYYIEFIKIIIMIKDRTIRFKGSKKWLKNYRLKWIKDLIQANLVEKI